MMGYQFAGTIIAVALALAAVMTGAWLIWRFSRNSGWVDATWTFGLGAIGIVGALSPSASSDALTSRQIIVALLVASWSLRLGLHIAQRTARISDDPRYAKLSRAWGSDAPRRMFWLLQKQALVSIPLAISMLIAAWNPAPGLRLQDWIGALVLVAAIAGEAASDRQLRNFRADSSNRDSICAAGLWNWSRHPNYFFEWLGWLSYPLLAIDLGGAQDASYPWGWITIAGPMCMYWLLVHVSGIPPLEAHMLERHEEEYRAYQMRTRAFFPAPPQIVATPRRAQRP